LKGDILMARTVVDYRTADNDLYRRFGKGFVETFDDAVKIASGEKRGIPARPWIDELIKEAAELERLEDERDLATAEEAWAEYLKNPVSYTVEEMEERLGFGV
jgi:hypothetical protein